MKTIQITIDHDFYQQALDLRYELFFKEFDLPKDVVKDQLEDSSKHLGIALDNELIAYGRLTDLGSENYKISQVVVRTSLQGSGYGKELLKGIIKYAQSIGANSIELNSQVTAKPLYYKFGFKESGTQYPSKSTGIPHVRMVLCPIT